MFTPNQARQLNEFIDLIHNPSWWSYAGVLALVFIVESYLPKSNKQENNLLKNLAKFKFYILSAFTFVFLGQGLFGGCIIQLPQNWIAQTYLNKEYWYPYGLVYREYFAQRLWPLLRFFYLIIGYYSLERTWIFYHKFLKFHNINFLRNILLEKLKHAAALKGLQSRIQNSFWF